MFKRILRILQVTYIAICPAFSIQNLKSQNVGIGIATPGAKLHVEVPNTWKDSVFLVSYSGQPKLVVNSLGNVGVGVYNPLAPLVVSGKIWQVNTNYSILIGERVLYSGSSGYSVLVGYEAAGTVSSAVNNVVGIGYKVFSQTGGSIFNSVAIGDSAMLYSASGVYAPDNIAIGSKAMKNVVGPDNIAIGSKAMYNATGGNSNIAIGTRVMEKISGGARNVVVGAYAMQNNTTGTYNTALGYQALYKNESGWSNVAVGIQALSMNRTGHQNTAIGGLALSSLDSGSNNVAIGYSALLRNINGNGNVAIGWQTIQEDSFSSSNVAIGFVAMKFHSKGNNNVAIGSQALVGLGGAPSLREYNVSIGSDAHAQCLSCSGNIAIGHFSGNNEKHGMDNVAVGRYAMYVDSLGYRNVAVGFRALTGLPLWRSDTGNVAIGAYALEQAPGQFNTSVGYNSAFFIPGGVYVVNSTAIGYDSRITDSNQVRIGNSAVSSIGGFAPWTNFSDERFKEIVNTEIPGTEFILRLKPIAYRINLQKLSKYLGEKYTHALAKQKEDEIIFGFSAQQVDSVAQSMGITFYGVDKPDNNRTPYGLRYAMFVVPLVKAFQEQQKIIASQQKQIVELQKTNAMILQELEIIKQQLKNNR